MFNYQKSKTTSTTFSPLSSLTKISQTHPPHHRYLFSLFSSSSQTQPPPSSSLNSLYLTLTNTLNIHSLLQRPTRRSSKPYPPINTLTSQQKFFSAVSPPSTMAAPSPAISSPPTLSPIPIQHFLLAQIRTSSLLSSLSFSHLQLTLKVVHTLHLFFQLRHMSGFDGCVETKTGY